MPLVSSGVEHGNLRELALARMRDFGTQCRDVRTREVGIQEIHHKVKPYEVSSGWVVLRFYSSSVFTSVQAELIRRDYAANGGWETFLSYEDPEQDILIGLLRLRKCSEDTYRPELVGGCSIVRELHVYGSVVPVHARDPTKFQHQVPSSASWPPPRTLSCHVCCFLAGLWHAADGGSRKDCQRGTRVVQDGRHLG